MAPFTGDYLARLRGAFSERAECTVPHFSRVVVWTVVLALAYIVAAVLLSPSTRVPEYHFVEERGAVTALSAILLSMAAGFSLVSFFVVPGGDKTRRVFWLITTAALAFLAFDELMEFHERVGEKLDQIALLQAGMLSWFRGWNDIVIIAYGVVGLPLLAIFLPTVARHPKMPELIGVAFLFYVAHTVIDATQEPPTTYSIILEEAMKLFSAAFLALASFCGLAAIIRPPGRG